MAAKSAGILLYRREGDAMQVLLVHPGGPFWRRKDLGAWSIPKGEHGPEEDAETAARREFGEELGPLPPGHLVSLGQIRQRGGKIVEAFALEAAFDAGRIAGGSFQIEWPPRSGRLETFPEIDQAAWFSLEEARRRINPAQRPFLDRLQEHCIGK